MAIFVAPAEDWDKHFAVNVRGVFLCYKHAGRQMVRQGKGGRIIGASSTAGKQGDIPPNPPDCQRHSLRTTISGLSNMATYCTTKFAVRGLTQSLGMLHISTRLVNFPLEYCPC